MEITNVKKQVTEQMMFKAGLSKYLTMGRLGIPFSATQKDPIKWYSFYDNGELSISKITEEEFDRLEAFFIQKEAKDKLSNNYF